MSESKSLQDHSDSSSAAVRGVETNPPFADVTRLVPSEPALLILDAESVADDDYDSDDMASVYLFGEREDDIPIAYSTNVTVEVDTEVEVQAEAITYVSSSAYYNDADRSFTAFVQHRELIDRQQNGEQQGIEHQVHDHQAQDQNNTSSSKIGSGIVSGAVGMLVGGPILGIALGIGAVYASNKDGVAGDAARALGDVAMFAKDKAQELEQKHQVVHKTHRIASNAATQSIKTAQTITHLQGCHERVWSRARNFVVTQGPCQRQIVDKNSQEDEIRSDNYFACFRRSSTNCQDTTSTVDGTDDISYEYHEDATDRSSGNSCHERIWNRTKSILIINRRVTRRLRLHTTFPGDDWLKEA